LQNLVTLQLAAAYSEGENAERLSHATKKRLDAASAALSEQRVLARIGEVTAQSLLDSEQVYREAVISQIDSQVQILIADIKIRRALGRLTRPSELVGEPNEQ
jgi:outer membrane protein TolC